MDVKKICLYTELESFSGSIKHEINYFPILIKDLKLACLLYDKVIVNTPVLVEHPLTLPAFELLSPFVKSGILWTKGKIRLPNQTPYLFVKNKIDMYSYIDSYTLIKSKNELLDRWENITPNKWSLFRDDRNQIFNATNNIHNSISKISNSLEKNDYFYISKILEEIERMQSDHIFDRDYMLSKISTLIGYIPFEVVKSLIFIIQSEYLRQGTNNINDINIEVFPGFFVKEVNKVDFICNLSTCAKTISTAIVNFKKIGYSLNCLLNLPINELYRLATSIKWIKFRNHILSNGFSNEIKKEVLSLYLEKTPFDKTIDILYKNISPAPVSISSDWQILGKSLLGTAHKKVIKSHNLIILDLSTRTLYLKNTDKSITLEPSHLVLLSALISSGDTGLHIEQIIKLYKAKKYSLKKRHEYKKIILDRNSTKNNIFVLRNKINHKINFLDLFINKNAHDFWIIEKPKSYDISITGSFFDKRKLMQSGCNRLHFLTKNDNKLFSILFFNSPYFLNSERIAKELNIGDINQKKKVSDTIYRLEKKLLNTEYKIIKDYVGGYALVQYN